MSRIKLSLFIQREALDALTIMAVAEKCSVTDVVERLALLAKRSIKANHIANQEVQHGR